MGTRFQPRADTGANWTAANPVLLLNEVGYDTTAKQFKMGDGVSAWSLLPYATFNSGVPVTWTAEQTFDAPIIQTPGQGANNSSPFAQYGDLFSDAIVTTPTPTFPTSTTLSSTTPALVAYALGQRVAYAGGSYTVGASATSYLDLSNTGVLTVSTSGTVTANSLRLATVTSSATAITGVVVTASVSPTFIPLQTNISYFGSAQALAAGTFTALIFPTLATDTLSEYDPALGAFTPREDGIYLIFVSLESVTAVTNQRVIVSISETAGTDGTRVLAGYTSSAAELDISASRPVTLVGGTPYYFNCYVTAAETLDGATNLQIVRLK